MDSGHVTNKKVRLLMNEFDSNGYFIWKCLIDYAYGKWGYYFDLRDEEEVELFATEYCRKPKSLVMEVIAGCVRRGLFDKTVADMFGILTSVMMQETFIFATSERRAKGSTFELQSDWLLLDFEHVPPNILILPGKKGILLGKKEENPPNNSQTKQDKTETKQNLLGPAEAEPDEGLDSAKPVTDVEAKAKRSRMPRAAFAAPSIVEITNFFRKVASDPSLGTERWTEDQIVIHAADMFDHYKSVNWRQGQGTGKPIVDWQAAARRWIRKAKEIRTPTPSRSFTASETGPVAQPQKQPLNKFQRELNYFFELYREDPSKVTVISLVPEHYDQLKQAGLIDFPDDVVAEIRNEAEEILRSQNVDITEQKILRMMKRVGVVKFFLTESESKSPLFV
jgi:hypothetical protein